MTGKQKIFLACGLAAALVVIPLLGAVIWLMTLPEGGVKLANQMDGYALEYIRSHDLLMPSEELVAYYDATLKMDGTEAALLTTQRVLYHKDGRTDAIDLCAIEDVEHHTEALTGDYIEIQATDGRSMMIEIAALNGGGTFHSALMKGWRRAKTNPSPSDRPEAGASPR